MPNRLRDPENSAALALHQMRQGLLPSNGLVYRRILVPLDGSPLSLGGLEAAIELARLTGGALRLIHVCDALTMAAALKTLNRDVVGMMKEVGARILEDGRAHAEANGIPVSTCLVDTSGTRVSEATVAHAAQWGADLIVLGTHGRRGMARMLLGSDAEQIMRLSHVPVLTTRQKVTQLSFRIPSPGHIGGPVRDGSGPLPVT